MRIKQNHRKNKKKKNYHKNITNWNELSMSYEMLMMNYKNKRPNSNKNQKY